MADYRTHARHGLLWLGSAGLVLLAAHAEAQANGAPAQAIWLLGCLLVPLAWGAFQALVVILFPRWTAAAREAVEERRWACIGWGAAIALLTLLVVLAGTAAKGPLAGLAGFVLMLVALAGVLGFVGVAAAVGARLVPSGSPVEERTPWQALVGGLTLGFACLTPILGQVLALAVSLAGLGAAARTLVTGLRTVPPPAEEPTP